MKIRTGFVSNSSTTSFCIYGMRLQHEEALEYVISNLHSIKEFEKYLKKNQIIEKDVILENDDQQLFEKLLNEYEVSVSDILDYIHSCIDEKTENNNIIEVFGDEYDLYIGVDIGYIQDDETFGEFKVRAEQAMKQLLPFTTYEQLNLITESVPG